MQTRFPPTARPLPRPLRRVDMQTARSTSLIGALLGDSAVGSTAPQLHLYIAQLNAAVTPANASDQPTQV